MAIPAALKSTPALFALGTVGVVGITAATLSSSGGGGAQRPHHTAEHQIPFRGDDSPEGGEYPDTYTPSREPVVSEAWSVPTAGDMDPAGAPDWKTLDRSKNSFNLYPSRCTRSFFADEEEKLKGPLDSEESEDNRVERSTSLRVTPKPVSGGTVESCSMVNLKSKGRNFLFRSELAAKNSRVGLSLFTGAKNVDDSDSTGLKIRVVNYLLLFEKNTSSNPMKWTIKGGYSWGGSASPLHVKSLAIRGPKDTINRTFSGSGGEDSPETSDFYGGFWRAEAGHSTPIFGRVDFKATKYEKGNKELVLSHLDVSGYGEVDGVYDVQTGKWKRLKDSPKAPTFTSAIEAWLSPFRNKSGSWRTIIEHCGSHATLPEDRRLNHICYVSA